MRTCGQSCRSEGQGHLGEQEANSGKKLLAEKLGLSGLVAKLKDIALDVREVEDDVKKSRRAVVKPGYRMGQPR